MLIAGDAWLERSLLSWQQLRGCSHASSSSPMHTRALAATGSSARPVLLSAHVCCSDSDMPVHRSSSSAAWPRKGCTAMPGSQTSCHRLWQERAVVQAHGIGPVEAVRKVRCSNGRCPTMLVTRGQQEVFEHQQAAGALLEEAEVLGAWLLGRLHALQQPATRTCVETASTPGTEAAAASCFVPCIHTSGRSIATVVLSWPNTRCLTTSPMSCLIPDHPERL